MTYEVEGEEPKKCDHEQWVKMCVLCGEVLEDLEDYLPKTGYYTDSSGRVVFLGWPSNIAAKPADNQIF